jgi:hypothetical protein
VFRRFASLCRDQKAACDAAFRFGALVRADAAVRCALADDRIACFCSRRPPRPSRNEVRIELLLRHGTRRSSRQNAMASWQVPKAAPRQEMHVSDQEMHVSDTHRVGWLQAFIAAIKDTERYRRLYRKQTGS